MFKSIALAAVCSAAIVAAGSARAATPYNFTGLSLEYSATEGALVSGLATSGSFWSALTGSLHATGSVIDTAAYSSLFSYVTTLYPGAGFGYTALGENFVFSSFKAPVAGQPSSVWSDILTLTDATSSTAATVTFGGQTLTASVTAVPGPVAGAGLPVVLGMVGFAAWRRRKGMVTSA